MKQILKHLKHYKIESLLAPFFKMTEACLELIVPLIVTKIIDYGIGFSDKAYVYKMGAVLFALGATGLISSVTAQYFAAKAAIGCGTSMRNALFAHINRFSFSDIDEIGTSALITRLTNDINQVQTGVNMVLRLFLRSPFIVFGSMIMAFTIDVKSAMVFTVVIPLLFAVVFGIMFMSIPVFKKIQNSLDKITLLTRENLSGVRVIRAFNRQKKEAEDFEKSTASLVKLQMFVGRISALLNPVTYVILNLAIIAVLYKGAGEVYAGRLTQGAVVALVNYMSQILVELVKLSNLIVTMNKAAACSKRIEAVFDKAPTMEYPEKEAVLNDSENAVEFKNVSFFYNGSKESAIENVSFSAKKGSTIGIIGATGSGKSTLINLIPRFYDCSEGEVSLFGSNIKMYSKNQLQNLIAVVPQKSVLFNGSIKENLLIGNRNASDEEICTAISTAQAEEFVNSKDGGIDYIIEQDGKNLSGGQKQRLTIARALVKNSPILIFDDSMSALDFATDARLRSALKETLHGTTVFIVSQRVSTVKNADLILVMDDGRLAGAGTHDDLFENCGEYREICLSQLSEKEAAK
ncbi:MAG: ABC transporter ATP-binding protein/permease [Clostridia bacterium]|nr:ABC transporter ATP-binding protein/permease [Clostridia bacterium]